MNDIQRAEQAAELLSGASSKLLRSMSEACKAYSKEAKPVRNTTTTHTLMSCGDAALHWCKINGYQLRDLTGYTKSNSVIVYGRHMIRRDLYEQGYRLTAIAKTLHRNHATITASRDMPVEMIEGLIKAA